MTEILIIIILICGFIALAQAVNSISENPGAFIPVTIILAMLYIMLTVGVWYIYVAFGRNKLIIYGALVFVVLIMLAIALKFLIRHRHSTSKAYTLLFAIYGVIVLYVTLFSRKPGTDTSIEAEAFRGLEMALAINSFEPLEHSLLNLVLFLPFGFIIPSMNRYYLSRWGFAVIGGLVVSTVIEGIQMIGQLGQCDIDDIIFNTIGAALGYLFFVLKRRINKNWRIL